jgi:6-pyruvoyltetrahydropterin/6-carboxytetrahydropterin synthase
MYAVSVRDHVMIAHSLKGEVFGPAQRLHGATYVVDTEYRSERLDADGIVVDIGLAARVLRETLAPLAYRNLDEVPELSAMNTTTEFLARFIHGKVAGAAARFFRGTLKVTLHETPSAWASFEGPVA